MGGSSKKTTVGYKYYLGEHMVLCHGPIDHISRIEVDKKRAYTGFAGQGSIYIDRPGMFGGEEREGGIQGTVDILLGGPDQKQNSYLQSQLGDKIPAFRGVVSVVLRRIYLGMNPYLKPWAFRARRVFLKGRGEDQWYRERAPIGNFGESAIYIAMDFSGSVSGSKATAIKEAITSVLRNFQGIGQSSNVDIRLVSFSDGAAIRTQYGVTSDNIQSLIDFVNGRVATGGTNYEAALNSAPNFFNTTKASNKILLFLSDGQPTDDSLDGAVDIARSLNGVSIYGYGIEVDDTDAIDAIDNTGSDGVPVVQGDSQAIQEAIFGSLFSQIDLNPAHIIRECLTDDVWGMGYLEDDIDDASFRYAADTLQSEAMGISLLWDKQVPIEDFVKDIIRHINATLYVDRTSGKFSLKLIRNDYNIDSLLELDESNIAEVTDYNRVTGSDVINSVTVVYWDATKGEDGSVTADDSALIQSYGSVVNNTIQYPGFTNANIAARAAARDLQTLSSPLLSCTIEANREASGLNIGDVFKFYWPQYHDSYVLMRVHQIAFGNGRSNRVKITCTEDVFSTPEVSPIVEEEPGWVEPKRDPEPVPYGIVQEAPYYEFVQLVGQNDADSRLADNPESSYLISSAVKPGNAINATLFEDSGSGFNEDYVFDFSPSVISDGEIEINQTVLKFKSSDDLDLVEIGTHCQINNELVSVEAIDTETKQLTVKRGILDTVPVKHGDNSYVIFWDNYAPEQGLEYVLGEEIDCRILSNAPGGQLPIASAQSRIVKIQARASLPYRPAGLAVQGDLYPDKDLVRNYPLLVTWKSRNRFQETAGFFLGWEDDGIISEDGVTYKVRIYALDSDLQRIGIASENDITGNEFSFEADSIPQELNASPYFEIVVHSLKEAQESYQAGSLVVKGPFQAPAELSADYAPYMKPLQISYNTKAYYKVDGIETLNGSL